MEPLPFNGSKLWRSHQIAHSLSSAGKSVTYITSSFDHFRKKYRSFPDSLQLPYLIKFLFASSYVSNKSIARLFSSYVFSFSLFLKALAFSHRPAVWVVSYPHSPQILAICFAKIFNPRLFLVVDLRDAPFQPSLSIASSCFNYLERLQINLWIKFVDRLIGVGPDITSYFSFKRIPFYGFQYVPMSCQKIQTPDRVELSIRPFDNKCFPIFIFFGTLTNSFDIVRIASLFHKQVPCRLEIVGTGPLLGDLTRLFSVSSSVVLHGYLALSCIAELSLHCQYSILCYSEFDCQRFEAHFTNKFSESLQLGLTILIPKWCTAMADFVEKHGCGYVYQNIDHLSNILSESSSSYPPVRRDYLHSVYHKYFSPKVFNTAVLKAVEFP